MIPTHAEAEIDCRVMPGTDETAVHDLVASLLDPLGIDWELEWVDTTTPNQSPADSPLRDSVERVLRADVPQAILAPMVAGSFTDSRHFREFFPDTVAYGFAPFPREPDRHGRRSRPRAG